MRPNPAQASPHTDNVAETVSTLRFGQRAKTIKTKVKPTPRRPGRRANPSLSPPCSHRSECTDPQLGPSGPTWRLPRSQVTVNEQRSAEELAKILERLQASHSSGRHCRSAVQPPLRICYTENHE